MMPADLDVTSAAVLSWLLTYAIHSTILLAGAAAIAWRFANQHAWLDVIWKAALIGPIVTASLSLGPNAIPLIGTMPSPAQEQTRPRAMEPAITVEPVTTPPIDGHSEKRVRSVAMEQAGSTVWQPLVGVWPSVAVIAWLLIAGIGLARYGTRLFRFYRAARSGRSVTAPDLLHAVDVLTESTGVRRVKVTTSDICAVPLALAGRQIVLPERFLEELDADQQRAAVAHEMAHVIRRDPAWRVVAAIVEHAFFFQPLNRVARSRITESAEFLCDQWAVRHTGAPVALARCLSLVASWASPTNDEWAVGVNAMARSDSAMIRRVTHILSEPAPLARRPRALWLVIPLAFVALTAPRVTAMPRPEPSEPAPKLEQIWPAAEIARAQANLRVFRPDRPGDSLDDRWRWALADARRQRFSEFWIAYSFETPVHAQDHVMSDSDGNSFVSSDGRIEASGPPLIDVLRDGGGNIVVLLHYRGTGDGAIDRAAYRSAKLGFDFERAPLFWLGYADESQSFNHVRGLFERVRTKDIQHLLIDVASMHGNSNLVIPFLTQLVDASQPSDIRNEAAEGFGHHHDPRSVEILLRVARTDPLSDVRAEAAETIGEVQTPQAIAALTGLVNDSDDPAVRREAAEAFGDQPADQALPALERVISTISDDEALNEAVEALGDIDDSRALDVLMRIIWEHNSEQVQREAVETIGDREEDAGAMAALERILRDHSSEAVQAEAIETLTDISKQAIHPQILELAASGKSPRIRREAIDAIADAVGESSDAQVLDRAEQTLERAIFDDPDTSVRMEALDALEKLPRDRELAVLRRVIDRHPDSRVRREAEDNLRDRRQ
jgi:HEAT repeat protein/beta-lactamase regulating signal transducer with metallopeptidase domain